MLVSLEISKKRGLSINPDIHHSKVPSSELRSHDTAPLRYCRFQIRFVFSEYDLFEPMHFKQNLVYTDFV